MKYFSVRLCMFFFVIFYSCKESNTGRNAPLTAAKNQIHYAKGLSIYKYTGFSIVRVSDPWPEADKDYTYILKEKQATVPDSLRKYTAITVPITSIVVTSTTHIPSLEMLGVENTLTGFPNTSYISSEKIRTRIDAGKVSDLGSNQSLNTERVIDLAPDVIIGYGIDNHNPTLDNLQRSGLKVLLDGDWNEQTPLGKAEWIKLFGALYGLDEKADKLFAKIESTYNATLALAKTAASKPTVLAGSMYEDKWYLPQGTSWGAQFIRQAGGNYLWADTNGTGSLSLPFETVLEKAKDAAFWIGPSQFTSLKEMADSNPNYNEFNAFRNGNVYSFSTKKGKTGGIIYYELAPNRPDLVIQDMLRILHPELLPKHKLFFFEQLK